MRLSSFRALFLALAMVVQTIAGGWGVAHAATGSPASAISAHCEKGSDTAGGAGDARHGGAHHMCGACCLSAGSQPVSLADIVSVVIAPRAFGAAGFVLTDASCAPARISLPTSARGPPTICMRA